MRLACLAALALLAACNAPDYTPVRDWARTASLATGDPVLGAAMPPAAPDGVLAMQDALATYLSALAVMADDGVLPYPEDPFVDLAARAATADPAGGAAVAAIGGKLRHATRGNWRAPQLRDAIVDFDPAVQDLVKALAAGAERAEPPPEAPAERLRDPARRAAAAQATQDRAALARARSDYAALIRQVGEGHAMLAAHAARITRDEAVQLILAQQDRLRRAMLAMPRPVLRVPDGPT